MKNNKNQKVNDYLFNKIKSISQFKIDKIWSLQFIKFNLLIDNKIIFPNISLIKNIGFDGSGINSKITNKLNTFYKKVNIKKNGYSKIIYDKRIQKKQTTVLSERVKFFY